MPRREAFVVAAVLAAVFGGLTTTHAAPERAWLGVVLDPGSESRGFNDPAGVRVAAVIRDSPAEQAGLRAGDRVVAVDGSPIATPYDLIRRFIGLEPGVSVTMTVDRRGRDRDLRVRLERRPRERERLREREGTIGAEAIGLPGPLQRHFGAPAGAGVMISSVEPGSPAEAAGLSLGDVVYEADGQPVRDTAEWRQRVRRGGIGNDLELAIVRDGRELILEATVVEAPQEDARD